VPSAVNPDPVLLISRELLRRKISLPRCGVKEFDGFFFFAAFTRPCEVLAHLY
jgi:hypothetical protein